MKGGSHNLLPTRSNIRLMSAGQGFPHREDIHQGPQRTHEGHDQHKPHVHREVNRRLMPIRHHEDDGQPRENPPQDHRAGQFTAALSTALPPIVISTIIAQLNGISVAVCVPKNLPGDSTQPDSNPPEIWCVQTDVCPLTARARITVPRLPYASHDDSLTSRNASYDREPSSPRDTIRPRECWSPSASGLRLQACSGIRRHVEHTRLFTQNPRHGGCTSVSSHFGNV